MIVCDDVDLADFAPLVAREDAAALSAQILCSTGFSLIAERLVAHDVGLRSPMWRSMR